MTEANIKKEFDDAYQEAYRAWDGYLAEAKTDLAFKVGDPWDAQLKRYLKQQRREALSFNKIRRIINLITGYQRQNRLAFRVDAMEASDEATAKQFSGLLQAIVSQSGGYQILSDAFEHGALSTGLNLVEIYSDHTDDPVNGDLRLGRVPFSRCLLDPNMAYRDLRDCNYILRRDWVAKKQAKVLLPSKADAIAEMTGAEFDNKFAYARKTSGADNLLRWDEYWRRDSVEKTVLIDSRTGKWQYWPGKKDARLKLYLEMHPEIIEHKVWVPTVKYTVLVEDQVMYDGADPLGIDDYPFVPVIGYFDPEHDEHRHKLQGVIRALRDPQSELNKRRSQIIDIFEKSINSGWMAEEDAVANPASLYQSGQGNVVWLKSGALAGGKVQEKRPADIPASMFQLQETLDRDIMEIPGANADLLGMPSEKEGAQVAGILAKLRQSQGLINLQSLFDNYRESKRLVGDKMIKAIQKKYLPSKVESILGEPPTPEFYSQNFGKYRAAVVEGVLTDTQRQMYYNELLHLKQIGAPIPWAAIMDAAPIEKKDDLQKIVAQQEQSAAQEMQRQQQLEMVRLKAEMAQAQEMLTQAEENRASAAENRMDLQLDRVKALKELQGMDLDRLSRTVQALSALQQMQDGGQQVQGGPRRMMTRR